MQRSPRSQWWPPHLFLFLSFLALAPTSEALRAAPERGRSEPSRGLGPTSDVAEDIGDGGSRVDRFDGPAWDPLLNCSVCRNTTLVENASLTDSGLTQTQQDLLCTLRHKVGITGAVYAEPHFRMKSRFATCAVVSSSGVLNSHWHGAAIDSAQMVMRFNSAPTGKWAGHVGSRDDIRLVNNQFIPRALGKPEDSRDAQVIRNHSEWYAIKPTTTYTVIPMVPVPLAGEFHQRYPYTELYVLDEAVHSTLGTTLREIYQHSHFSPNSSNGVSFTPTTGALGMLSALVLCDEVRAYGMAATPAAASAQYSYYAPVDFKANENPWHKSFSAEKDLWRRLATNQPADLDATEVAVIPGFSKTLCPAHLPPAYTAWRPAL